MSGTKLRPLALVLNTRYAFVQFNISLHASWHLWPGGAIYGSCPAGASRIRTLGPSLWSRRRLLSRPCPARSMSHPIAACTLAFGGEAQEFLLHGLDLGEIYRDVVLAGSKWKPRRANAFAGPAPQR